MFFAVVATLAGLSYAYFAYTNKIDIATVKANSPTYVTVKSEYEMHKVIFDPVDNANTALSKKRYAVKLGADIKLTDDMIITRDIALDLGKYQFDLNGHTLKILHTYEGKTVIKNETIDTVTGMFINTDAGTPGKIDISTPNAEISSGITAKIAQDSSIQLLSFSENRLVQDVYQFVKERMFDYYWHDLALPTHYYNYDIKFAYSFNVDLLPEETENDYINNDGHILKLPTTKRNAEMILSITSETLFSSAHTALKVPFVLLPSKPSTTFFSERMAAAEEELLQYFDYYRWGSDNGDYYIFNNLSLPNTDAYYGISLSYSAISTVYDDEGVASQLTNGDLSISNGKYILHKYNTVTNDGQRHVALKVTFTFDDEGVLTTANRTYNFHIITNTNYDIASQIINDIGVILVKDGKFVLPTLYDLRDYGIKNVSYAVKNEYFKITGDDNNIIEVTEVGYPPITQKVYLEITFDFLTNTPLKIVSESRIYCEAYGSGGGDETYDQYFDAYYDLHARLVAYLDNGTRFAEFQMPNETVGRTVRYGIIRTSELPADLTTLSMIGYESVVLENGDTLAYIDTTNPALTEIKINFDKIPLTDTNVTLLYSFNATSWYGNGSSFTIPGVIREDTVVDANLFAAMKEVYDANNDGVLLTSEALAVLPGAFIIEDVNISDWSGIELLSNLTELEIRNSTIAVADMARIARLSKLTKLTIDNCGITNAALAQLPKFDKLKYLNLSRNGITSLDQLPVLGSLVELDVSGNSILSVSTLGSYPSLTTLNISNNQINIFEDLRKISHLSTVRLYNNLKSGSSATTYGALGTYNITSFTIMAKKGIEVYYKLDSGTEVLFTPTDQQLRGAEILEAISYTSNGNGKIELTETVYASNGSIICTISYLGADFDFVSAGGGKIYATIKPELVVSGKTYYITASTIVDGVTITRLLEVRMP